MTSFFGKWTATCAATLTLTATTAWSDDAVLYDAPPPADAAFVRILAERADDTAPVAFGGKEISFRADQIDTYLPISAANLDGVTAGMYYSLSNGPAGTLTITEPPRETVAKVHLFLINSGADEVRLIAPDQGLEVIAALEVGEAASRAVNPIEISLAVERVNDGTVLGHFDVKLSRGRNLTFVAGDTSARMIENRIGQVVLVK